MDSLESGRREWTVPVVSLKGRARVRAYARLNRAATTASGQHSIFLHMSSLCAGSIKEYLFIMYAKLTILLGLLDLS